MTTTCPQTPMDSVSTLRTALRCLSAAGLTEAYLTEANPPTETRLNHDFAVFAHPHQEHGEAGNNQECSDVLLVAGSAVLAVRIQIDRIRRSIGAKGAPLAETDAACRCHGRDRGPHWALVQRRLSFRSLTGSQELRLKLRMAVAGRR